MKIHENAVLSIALLTALCAAPAFAITEKPIAVRDLPAAVRKTIESQVGSTGAKIKHTTVEVAKGKTMYECESVRANGKEQDFEVDAQGKLGEVEDAVELSALPAAVKAAVDKAMEGGGVLKELVSVTRDGKLTGYGATVAKNGKSREYEMGLDGRLAKD